MGPFRRLLTPVFLAIFLFLLTTSVNTSALQTDDATAAGRAPSPRAAAALPRVVRFAGALPRVDDAPRTGVVTLTFTMYSEAQGGSPVWVETQNVTVDEQGRYAVLLGAGSGEGLPGGLFARGEARWLGVRIAEEGGVEQSRVQLVSVPYALAAADAHSLGGRPASDFQLTRTASTSATDGGAAPGVETSGTVTSTTNTVGRIAKFTALDTLGDSVLIESAGNIGIGTVPTFPLHILANSTSAALAVGQNNAAGFGLLVRSGNDATPAFLMNNAANSANKHIFYGNGDAALGLGGGRIGIGTSGPAYPLHIEANNTSAAMTLVQNNVNGFAMLVRSGNDNTPAFLMNNAANSANRHIFYGSGDAYFALGGGNVGIGTSGPSQKLQVAGTIYSSTGGFRFPDNTVQTTAATGGGAGDITSVIAGNGLAGGATSGDATLNIKTCTEGQVLKYVGTTWTCSVDATSGAGGGATTFSGSTVSALVSATQTGSASLAGEPTFASAQTNIPAALVGIASSTSTTNVAVGVAGFSYNGAPAVVGWNGSTGGGDNEFQGVAGITENSNGIGVSGEANAVTGVTRGVEGFVQSTSGIGVSGVANANTGGTIGVMGEVNSQTGTAGYFSAPTTNTAYLLRGGPIGGPDNFKVDGMGAVFASAYKDLAGNPISGGGSGDITGVTAGTGLTGGATSGNATLSVDTAAIQARVTGTCSTGNAIKAVAANGTVTCEPAGGAAGLSVYDAAGNALSSQRIVRGYVVLALGTATITLSGSAVFTNNSSYGCTATYAVFSNPAPNHPLVMGVYQLSGTQFVIRGPEGSSSPGVNYICIGN